MASFDSIIGITIKAVDGASAVVDKAASNISAAQSAVAAESASAAASIGASLDAAGQKLTSTGKTMTAAVTVPVVAALGASAKLAYDFNNQMELLRTSAGIPQSQIAALSDQVLALSGQVGQAPEKLAEGLYHIASAGNGIWSTAQMMDILKVSAEGANLGLADMDSTTYALSSTMASGIAGVKNATDAMSVLNAIVGAGDMRMSDLNAAISTGVLSTMKVAGVDIQSFGAALATLADNGEHADEASTRLRMSVALMTSPSGAATKQLEALGLTAENAKEATAGMNEVFKKSGLATTTLADDLRKPNGITVAMEDLQKHLEAAGLSSSETDAMLAKAFGGGRTDAALLTMLTNIDRLNDKYKAIGDSAGQFQQKVEDLNNTNNQKFRDAWSAVQADFTKFGESVLPQVTSALKQGASALGDFTKWFQNLSPWQKQAVVDLSLFAAAAGPVVIVVGSIARAIGSIIALGPAVSAFFAGFAAAARGAMAAVSTGFTSLSALISAPIVMPAIAVGAALASLALVYEKGQQTLALLQNLNNQEAADNASTTSGLQSIINSYKAGKISKAEETKLLQGLAANQHALGTNFAPGGLSLVGENGPELVNLPAGSQVYNNRETNAMMSGSGNGKVVIQNLNVNNNVDAGLVVRQIGWQLANAV